MNIEPKVSIISPCYNGEEYVEGFLTSVLEQTYGSIELIMVDDGSLDRSKDIILSFQPKFNEKNYELIYIYQENKGQAAAINQGLKIFTGEYLMWVDSDDILYKDNVEKKVRFLESHPECGFVLCKAEEVRSDALDVRLRIMGRGKPEGEDTLFEDLIYERNVCFNPCIIMARRDALLKSIPSRHIFESRQGQNWQLMLPLAHMYKCGYIDEILCKIVSHNDSHSRVKRTYEQRITRYEGFQELLTHTINGLVDMDDATKQVWLNRIVIQCQKKIWFEAKNNKDKCRIKSAKTHLRECGYDLRDDSRYLFKVKCYNSVVGKLLKPVYNKLRKRI